MNREELKRLFLTFPTLDIPEKKQIIVEIDKNPHWPGYGTIEILRDGPNGYSSFKTHQELPMKYVFNCNEYRSGEYELIVKE